MYFIILFVTGNFILLNVFLAIAVDNLSTEDEEEVVEEAEQPPPVNGKEPPPKYTQVYIYIIYISRFIPVYKMYLPRYTQVYTYIHRNILF